MQLRGQWIVRRLAPDCSRIELASLPAERDEARLLHAMGWETANIHLGAAIPGAVRRDLERQPQDWLQSAAEKMAQATHKDWAEWKEWSLRYNLLMDHDRLFKELLSTFFVEFFDLFLPDVGAALDHTVPFVPMDKEVFTDVTRGEKHEVDVLMKARFRGEDAFFLIHVENQATAQADFPSACSATSPGSRRNTTCPSIPSSSFPMTRQARAGSVRGRISG